MYIKSSVILVTFIGPVAEMTFAFPYRRKFCNVHSQSFQFWESYMFELDFEFEFEFEFELDFELDFELKKKFLSN